MTESNGKEEFVRKICDKRTLDALGILKTLNKTKYELVEDRIISCFNSKGTVVNYEMYMSLIKNIDQEVLISFQRRKDCFELDEIEEDI